jgi:hypothetical protein
VGTYVEEVRNWKRATSYIEKYLAKVGVSSERLEMGRIWGV